MVFEKNMIMKILTITLGIFFITSCTSSPKKIKKIEFSNYEIVTLEISEFNLVINEEKLHLTDDLGFDSKFLIDCRT